MPVSRFRFAVVFLVALLSAEAGAQGSVAHMTSGIDYPEFVIMGFGDVTYVSGDADEEDGFAIGQAVAHISAQLDDSFGVFGEFSLTAHDSEYTIEAERLFVKYDFSDLLRLSAGRYHTPIGYWNSAFHHGAWLQTTVSRPEMVMFGSKIVPIHFVGALIEGALPDNTFGLSYMAGFGNGRHTNVARAGDAGDINGERAWTVQLNASPERFFGMHTGIGFYSDRVTPDDRPEIDESTVSAYFVWAREAPEVLVEYLYSTHELVTDSSVNGNTRAWYAQFAYRLPGKWRAWKPYLRIESNDVDDSDPLLGDQGLNYDGGIVGVRWDFSEFAALKAEYRNEEFDDMGRENNFRLQVSFVLADF